MPDLRAAVGWPWRWLNETKGIPPVVEVRPSIQPTADVGAHWTNAVVGYREQFVMAAGLNTVVLPGFNRASSLNAAALPQIRGQGARRWVGLTWSSNTALAGGQDLQWAYGGVGANWTFSQLVGGSAWPAGRTFPIIRGFQFTPLAHGLQDSLYVPDPNFLFFSLPGQIGGEVVTLSGVFLETPDLNEPLPDVFL